MRPIIAPLTSARFFAALFVVIFHYDKKLQIFSAGLANFGYEAVAFFFILSGFILTYTHALPDGLNVSLSQFARSRLLRILPAYYLGLIIALPFLVASASKSGFDWGTLLVPAMLQSWWPPAALLWNSPAWSLSNEIFFYALFPAIWWFMRTVSAATALAIAAASVLVAVAILMLPLDHHFAAYFPLLNLPQFVLGVALGRFYLANGPLHHSRVIFAASLIALVAVIAIKPDHPWVVNGPILCSIFGSMIYAMAGMKNFMSNRILTSLGNASYALYILHVPIWMWWDRLTRVTLHLEWSAAFDFSVYLIVTIIVAVGVTRFLERPVRRAFSPKPT